jgi:phosphoribosyl 1,2-cyclic phosphodiesterase
MSLLLDCGFVTQRACKAVLDGIQGEVAVVVSHGHRDHLSRHGAKVLATRGLGIYAHHDAIKAISGCWSPEDWRIAVTPFASLPFTIGPFTARAIEVPHAPGFHNVALVLEGGSAAKNRKLVFCTDTYDATAIRNELADADFVYLESNHDLALLRRHPNPASHYHLSNPKCARLLCEAAQSLRRMPQTILLGHLSRERNRPELALAEVRNHFEAAGQPLLSHLATAPPFVPSEWVTVD